MAVVTFFLMLSSTPNNFSHFRFQFSTPFCWLSSTGEHFRVCACDLVDFVMLTMFNLNISYLFISMPGFSLFLLHSFHINIMFWSDLRSVRLVNVVSFRPKSHNIAMGVGNKFINTFDGWRISRHTFNEIYLAFGQQFRRQDKWWRLARSTHKHEG